MSNECMLQQVKKPFGDVEAVPNADLIKEEQRVSFA